MTSQSLPEAFVSEAWLLSLYVFVTFSGNIQAYSCVLHSGQRHYSVKTCYVGNLDEVKIDGFSGLNVQVGKFNFSFYGSLCRGLALVVFLPVFLDFCSVSLLL